MNAMRFNFTTKRKTETSNYEGAKAYALTSQAELYTTVVTSSLNDKFYEKSTDRINRLRELIEKNDPEFVAKLAVYAREKMHLRSVPLVIAVELAKTQSGNSAVGKAVTKIVLRADEITELLAYYQLANKRKDTKKLNKLSKQLQKGLSNAFNKFDEYQFAKYDRQTEVKLKDALFLVHPKAKDESQQALFNKIASGSLNVPYTWETELSALGQQKFENDVARKTAGKAKWKKLIASGKVGYMALMRNLRNILDADVDYTSIQQVCAQLTDAKAIAKSKQLPFRFLAAYRELKNVKSGFTSMVMTALETAVMETASNISGFDENTKVWIACDVSGSMQKAISAKSSIMNYDIGLMLAMLLKARCKNVVTGMFGDTWKVISMPGKNILANVDEFYRREGEVGYSTNGYLVIKDLLRSKTVVDKVMLFTDCQLWNSNGSSETISGLWKQYKQIAPNAKLYLFDLAGYGNTPLNTMNGDVYLIAGWSDKIFDVLAAIENGSNAVAEIEKVVL
jgi:60 kDa SS-A/Ro ribonucleoprotein